MRKEDDWLTSEKQLVTNWLPAVTNWSELVSSHGPFMLW